MNRKAEYIAMCMCGAQATFPSKRDANRAGWLLMNPAAPPGYEEAEYDRCPECGPTGASPEILRKGPQ